MLKHQPILVEDHQELQVHSHRQTLLEEAAPQGSHEFANCVMRE
jgi:hypothetical protein